MSLHTGADNGNLCNRVIAEYLCVADERESLDTFNCFIFICHADSENDIFCIISADRLENDINIYVVFSKL